MDPTGKIAPQPWMTAPETRAVLAALMAGGAEVRFVGGCVRDALVHRPNLDIDIATPEPPELVLKRLAAAGIKGVPTGLSHGTVTAVVGQHHYEITTLRVDVETDGRRARVRFTDDWRADASRRDFTINALSCTADGDVYDYFGGLEDLAHGRVCFVGLPRERIEEDVLRLLRFFRFHAWYGRPPPDAAALAACRAAAHRLAGLSGERVRHEMFRILLAADPASVVLLMRGERVLEQVLPEAADVGRLRMMAWLESRAVRIDGVVPDPVRRLGALVAIDGAGAEVLAGRLKLSNHQKRRLHILAGPPLDVDARMHPPALRRALRRAGPEAVRDMALLAWAAELAVEPRQPRPRTDGWIDLLETCAAWTDVAFPLKGRDVMALGVPHGPGVGAALRIVEAWWEDGDYRADRAACLTKLRTVVDDLGAVALPT